MSTKLQTTLSTTLRTIQLITATAVLILTILLLVDQNDYSDARISPAIYYAIAVGAVSIFFAILACIELCRTFLPGIASLGSDSVVASMNIAGGILLSTKLSGASCANTSYTYRTQRLMAIDILSGDCYKPDLDYRCLSNDEGDYFLNRRCRYATVVAAMMFVTAVVAVVAGVLAGLRRRSARGKMGGK